MTNTIRIETFNPSHDTYGNPTAHWQVWYNGEILASSGKKREQIGYCGRVNQAAAYFLRKEYGLILETENKRFERDGGSVEYTFSSEAMENCFYVELTDLFGGELNYSELSRFRITAKSERGAITKLAKYTGLSFRKQYDNVYHSTTKLSGATIEPFDFESHSQIGVIEL